MDESDVERGMMTGTMLLECRLSEIRRKAATVARFPRRECVECGDDIPEARIRAIPGSERCVDCQQASERGTLN